MTKQKHLKLRVRERMRSTGESYTTARLHVLAARPAPLGDIAGAVAGPAALPVPQLRLRPTLNRRTRGARRTPEGRYIAAAFTVLLTVLVGMIGLILVEGSEVSHAHSLTTPSPSAPSIMAWGQ